MKIFSKTLMVPGKRLLVAQSNWRILKERARDYNQSAESLATDKLWQNALEQAHFSVEIAMKATIAKAGYVPYPDSSKKGHDLIALAGCRIAKYGETIRKVARSDRRIQSIFNQVLSAAAWQMHHRYERHPLDSESIEELLEKYRRIYEWLMSNYVE